MSSHFYFGDSGSESDNEDNDTSTLPFPQPLAKDAFLTPEFDATEFLSDLSTRFQTLEDLQIELRELSQTLNKELVDLVNDNYQDFLTLGQTLQGGDEKVEDIRVGLLTFQRDVAGLKSKLDDRRMEVQALLSEKRNAMKEIEEGRMLLDFAERLYNLEKQLGLAQATVGITNGMTSDEYEVFMDDDSEDEDEDEAVPARTKRMVGEYLIVKLLMGKHNHGHPFLAFQQSRVEQVKNTILLDIHTVSKQSQSEQVKQALLQLHRTVGGQ